VADFVLWLTGLSGAGKTTLAVQLECRLSAMGNLVDRLDGDVIRTHLSAGLGYSKRDRDLNVERIAWVASRIARAGAIVIVAAISPYADARQRARDLVERQRRFVEVHVATPLEVCIHRDPKGLYRRALSGELADFTGISSPYETPAIPEIIVDTTDALVDETAEYVLAELHRLGLLCRPSDPNAAAATRTIDVFP
jgi:adenylyl-sulfate kinase